MTLTYRFHPKLTAGVEFNPRAEASHRVNPLVNWVALTETHRRPALIIGTSSDRIGTPSGQSFYATLSKSLRDETGLPIAPYAGVSYGTYEHRWLPLAGLNVGFTFEAILVAADAFKRAKTSDSKALVEAIRQTNITEKMTLGGPIKFNAKGQVEGIGSACVQNLKLLPTVVLPRAAATAKPVFPVPDYKKA